MDTSKEYIEMCEKAEEIQREWKPSEDDMVYMEGEIERGKWGEIIIKTKRGFQEVVNNPNFYKEFPLQRAKKYIKGNFWLPRQDQLQEMIGSFEGELQEGKALYGCPNAMLEDLLTFSEKDCDMNITSMEQLWLAFVMFELHQKHWNGTDWVKKSPFGKQY